LYPFQNPEIARQYGIRGGGGILLYGPPGTGKTMIARAVAGEIEAAFFSIKPSEVMNQWVGLSEQNIGRLFAEADRYPLSVIFIDEIESLAPKRRGQGSTIMQRVVPQILAELDGFEKRKNTLLFIGATNEPWALDPALLRPGRLDRLVYVSPPDLPARRKILELNLKNVALGEDMDFDTVAIRADRFSGADMAALAQRVREKVFTEAVRSGATRPLGLADFEAVLADMRPSVQPEDLKLYEAFAQKQGGK
jgi:SpoVK/Ycf46/Vps4 family AAA+-type ATPase